MSSELPRKPVVAYYPGDKSTESGRLPITWLWDEYPLAPGSWGNIQAFYDGADSRPLIRKWIDRSTPVANPLPIYRPADAPWPTPPDDNDVRQCYAPTADDIERVRRLFPDHPRPEAPPWGEVATRLILAGHTQPDPAGIRASTLLALLEQIEAASSTPTRRRTTTKTKRNTELDGAKLKVIAALTKYHRDAKDKIVNQEPLSCKQLAKLAGVHKSTASRVLKECFGSHRNYKKACEDYQKLATDLKLLNGEFTPAVLMSRFPLEQVADDDNDDSE